jgi:protease-4
VRTGPRADLFSLTRPRSETELKILQRGVDQVYDDFLERVSQGRKLDRAQVQAIAQGRVWTGRQALERGLVDELGGLEQAIRSAAKLARLGDDWQIRRDAREPRWQRLLDKLLGTGTQVRLPQDLRTLSRELGLPLDLVTRWGDRRGIYARLPYEGLDRV